MTAKVRFLPFAFASVCVCVWCAHAAHSQNVRRSMDLNVVHNWLLPLWVTMLALCSDLCDMVGCECACVCVCVYVMIPTFVRGFILASSRTRWWAVETMSKSHEQTHGNGMIIQTVRMIRRMVFYPRISLIFGLSCPTAPPLPTSSSQNELRFAGYTLRRE